MNERIKQLAEQAGFRSNPDIYDRNQSFDMEKFAELIVQECIFAIDEQCSNTDAEGTIEAIDILGKHFGVEE